MAKLATPPEAYCVQSKVKELVKKMKLKCSADVVEAVNRVVHQTVTKACERAKANNRKTLRGTDV